MSNRGQVTLPSGVDLNVFQLVGVFKIGGQGNEDPQSHEFGDGSGMYPTFTTELRIAEKVVLTAGLEPSYAVVEIPMARFGAGFYDEVPYAVAFNMRGPAGKLLLNTRASIYVRTESGQRLPLLNGTIVEVDHGVKNDDLILTIYCDKWLLNKITCFGQAQYCPETKRYGLVTNAPLIFNLFGYPDCLDTPMGPRFAPTLRYGWVQKTTGTTDTEEPLPGKATTRTRSWRVVDAIQYLRDMHYAPAGKRPPTAENYGRQVLGKGLVWPADIQQMLLTAGATRVLHNTSIQGLTLDAALAKLANRAGPYELYCKPGAAEGGDAGQGAVVGAVDADGAFTDLQTVFDTQMGGLNTGWSAGDAHETFGGVLDTATAALGTAMTDYVTQLGAPYKNAAANAVSEMGTYLKNKVAETSFADADEFRAAMEDYFKEFAAAMGVSLQGSPGRYTIPGGETSVATTSPVSVGTSLEQLKNTAPSGDSSELVFLDMRGTTRGGVSIPKIHEFDLATAMSDGANATEGFIKESIVNYFHDVCVVGDAPVYESIFSMRSNDTFGGGYLEAAWSSSDETAFKAYVTERGNTRQGFLEACQLYPLVFAAYRVTQNFMNRFAGTKYANAFASVKHPRIRPTLVTGYQQTQGSNPRNWTPRPITIEYYANEDELGNGTWTAASMYDNLEVSQDGQYFTVSALRDQGPGTTWRATKESPLDPQPGQYEGARLTPVKLRVTLAIELDFRIAGLSPKGEDPNKTKGRVAGGRDDGMGNSYTYTVLSEPGDYVDWLRYQSKPCGQIIAAAHRVFDDHASAEDELFSDKPTATSGRLPQNAKARLRDVRRVESSGWFKFPSFCPGYVPGLAVQEVFNSGLRLNAVVSQAILSHGSNDHMIKLTKVAGGEITRGVNV